MCPAQGHNAVAPVRFESASLRSRVKHSNAEQLRSHLANKMHLGPHVPKAAVDSQAVTLVYFFLSFFVVLFVYKGLFPAVVLCVLRLTEEDRAGCFTLIVIKTL